MKKLLYVIAFLFVAAPTWAADYTRLTTRLADHFNHAEWKEVLEVSSLMVELNSSDMMPYSMALISAQFLNDIESENYYLALSQRNRIPIDTLMQDIYTRTKLIHQAPVYEQLLLNLRTHNKWLSRVFNHYLLEYYVFARKTKETIDVANILLQATPNHIKYLKHKANALSYQGDMLPAVAIYENILQTDSCDYDALTFLGAYYTSCNISDLAQIDTSYVNDPQPIDSLYIERKRYIITSQIPNTTLLLRRANSIQFSQYLEEQILLLESYSEKLPMHPSHESNLRMWLKR